jgi:hypothetical protein
MLIHPKAVVVHESSASTRHGFWSGISRPGATPSHTIEPRETLALGEWEHTKTEFCARIVKNKSPFKILLKTKDDPYFLESWIQHHARIVGLNNLIIFDNMSSNEQVRKTYEKYQFDIPIIQFEGNHNALHHAEAYPELYECLEQACQFYVFLDTDEFLTLIARDTYTCDERIVDFLQAHEGTRVFPASWLWNIAGSDTRFYIGESLHCFGAHLAWGKPVLRSTVRFPRFVNHNINLDKWLFLGHLTPNLFVLHLARLFPQQRIETNFRKLIAAGFASPEDSLETILEKDVASVADRSDRIKIQDVVSELRELVNGSEAATTASATLEPGCIELGERGEILYYNVSVSDTLNTFLNHAQPFIRAVLKTDRWELQTSSFEQLSERWQEAVDYSETVSAVKRVARAQLPRDATVAVVSHGDPALLDMMPRHAVHFPQDDTGAYAGYYPRDDAEAVALVEALRARGTEFLVIPRTEFWWLDYYQGLRLHLQSWSTRIWQSADCDIYRLFARDGEMHEVLHTNSVGGQA